MGSDRPITELLWHGRGDAVVVANLEGVRPPAQREVTLGCHLLHPPRRDPCPGAAGIDEYLDADHADDANPVERFDTRSAWTPAAKVLEDLWRRLRGRELFPDMGSLRAFAETAGMKEFRPTKREQAITALLRHLIELPLAELRTTLARPVTSTAARTDEYERWVELILGRGEPPGTTSRGEQIARPSEPEASVDRDPD